MAPSGASIAALQRAAGNRAVALALAPGGRPPPGRPLPVRGGHVAERRSDVATIQTVGQPVQRADAPELDPFRGQSVNKPGQVSAPGDQYEIARDSGVNLRARPDGALPSIAKVRYGADVQVQALDTTGAFSFVVARSGPVGWINKDFLALDPPDSQARIHHITEDNLTTILKNEYVDRGLWKLETGNDYTTLAAAVVVANSGRKGVFVDWDAAEKYKEENPLKAWLDPWMIDNFAIYHGSIVLTGHNIWLPSTAYVRALQASGVIGSRPGWINAAVDVGKTLAGFTAGQVAGLFGSIWDTLTGLWDLAAGIVDTIRGALDGSLFAAISDIYDTIVGLTLEDAQRIVAELVTMGQGAFADFKRKWNHPDAYQQWFFKGYLVGAIALEVILAIFTGGASLAAKVLAKIGKYLPKLMRVLDALLDVAKKLPGRRDRGRDGDERRDGDDEDLSPADRSWEQARAMAALVTEEHDRRDTPVATLIPLLDATIATKFSGVKGYQAIRTGSPGTYKIVQRTRRRDVDDHYTEKEGTGEGVPMTKDRMIEVIKEIDSGRPVQFTSEVAEALRMNAELATAKWVPAADGRIRWKSIESQLRLTRWRFLPQAPEVAQILRSGLERLPAGAQRTELSELLDGWVGGSGG
ncbi:SH3 domain-containing protein [Occultella glacieicola]|uniref:SH3 domain-containing protein n=1 Tax=Occultella glacieicola TaxID=2518684 RepID=A0ABY2E4Y6_9MICO|nr:SH3 domain-containing protein [Occultella glacieicola]TDE95085.1 SH3 domain-containing protein [Occultella glacieicola]